jgi:hypothetical protein
VIQYDVRLHCLGYSAGLMAAKTSAPKKAAPRSKVLAEPSRRSTRASGMTDSHKQALALGREEGRAVRRYLEALEAHKPKRGRKRSADGINARLIAIEVAITSADPLTRVHLVQERMDLSAILAASEETVDLAALEDAFAHAAASYGVRKGISYAAWREAGVDASVLKRAGIPRTRA